MYGAHARTYKPKHKRTHAIIYTFTSLYANGNQGKNESTRALILARVASTLVIPEFFRRGEMKVFCHIRELESTYVGGERSCCEEPLTPWSFFLIVAIRVLFFAADCSGYIK